MRKVLSVLVVLGLFAGCAGGDGEDEETGMAAYMKAKEKETRLVMQKCREGKVGELPIAMKKSTLISIKNALTDTRVDAAFAKTGNNAGPVLKAELKKTYDCLLEDGVALALTGTATFALEAGKADDSENAPAGNIPAGSSGVSGSVYIPDVGNVSAAAVVDSETVATVLGATREGAQGAIEELKQLAECLADIADCLAHVGLRNSWCIQYGNELHPDNAACSDGCCSHTSMVGMVHCMPSCGAGGVEEELFSQCENVTPADNGKCAWNSGKWF